MESRAFVENISRSFGGDYLLTLRLDGIGRTELEGLNNSTPYRLKLGKWTERRSLDANAYLWVLCSKMAEVLGTSKDEVYEELLQRYGLVDEEVVITVKKSVDMSKVEGHWHLLKSDDKWSGYIRIRGTSEYDRREMAHFLDMVVEDAKEIGVETLTPQELERLKEAWGENSTPTK
jgi:hypothetical protein